ncbi:LPXTG cell wall anchor domain-containing protein [Enterococcus termitis]
MTIGKTKADENTRWYFSEDGYNYDEEKPKKDTEHNPDGKDPEQDIKPVVKETPKKDIPKEETPKETPKETQSLPYTGEEMMRGATVVGLLLILGVGGAMYLKRKKKTDLSEEKTEENK